MPNFYDSLPASLRRPVGPSRLIPNSTNDGPRPRLVPTSGIERAAALAKARFSPLPQEPEDAKLTGVTRSLHRRLLALNIGGSLLRGPMTTSSKIA